MGIDRTTTVEDRIATDVFKTSLMIHQKLGPGLLESVYEAILAYELRKLGYKVEQQVEVSLVWDELRFDKAFRADLVVNDTVFIEIKALAELPRITPKQLRTYVRLAEKRLGLVVNFGEELLKNGFHRVVNGLPEPAGDRQSPGDLA